MKNKYELLLDQFKEELVDKKIVLKQEPKIQTDESEELVDVNEATFELYLRQLYNDIVKSIGNKDLVSGQKTSTAKCIYFATNLQFEANKEGLSKYKKKAYEERSTMLLNLVGKNDKELDKSYEQHKENALHNALLAEYTATFEMLKDTINGINKKDKGNKLLIYYLWNFYYLLKHEKDWQHTTMYNPDLQWDINLMNLCIETVTRLKTVLENQGKVMDTGEKDAEINKLMDNITKLTKIYDFNSNHEPDPNPHRTRMGYAACVIAYVVLITLLACLTEPVIAVVVSVVVTALILMVISDLFNDDNFNKHDNQKRNDAGGVASSVKDILDPPPPLYQRIGRFFSSSDKGAENADKPLINDNVVDNKNDHTKS